MNLRIEGPARIELQALSGQFVQCTAVYVRAGHRKGHDAETVLVRNVRDASNGTLLADHLWFNRGRTWRSQDLNPGDVVAFTARSVEYRKGYWGPSQLERRLNPPTRDFRLTPPRDLTVIRSNSSLDSDWAA